MHKNQLINPRKFDTLTAKVILALGLLTTIFPSYAGVKSISIEREIVDEKGITYKSLDISCTTTKTKQLIRKALNKRQWCDSSGAHCSSKKMELANRICSKSIVKTSAAKKEDQKPIKPISLVATDNLESKKKLQDELISIKQDIIDIRRKLLELQKKEQSLTSSNF